MGRLSFRWVLGLSILAVLAASAAAGLLAGPLAAAGAGAAGAAGLAILAGRPLAELARAARAAADSSEEVRWPGSRFREIEELSRAFSRVTGALHGHRKRLSAERGREDAILESMAEGVIALDGDGRILLMNRAAGEIFGASPVQIRGQPLLEVVRHHEIHELMRAVQSERRPAVRELALFQPAERMLLLHGTPAPGGAPHGVVTVIVIRDLTAAQRYDRLRRDFVANVSHELKSPLTAIKGLTETLLDGAIEDRGHNRHFVRLIDDEAARLGRLIDDLLQLAQIEAGQAPMQRKPVALRELVEGLRPGWQAELTRRRLSLRVELSDGLTVLADPGQMAEVFINLVDNAVKYNRDGGAITITARPDGRVVRVDVSDTGIGIPAQDLSRVFERFYRVDKARSRQLGGTGLGLSIVKHIIELHGGEIAASSTPGHGSTFSFTLPLAA
ncbi:MAG TPA: ATP-binding protein [bacterium]